MVKFGQRVFKFGYKWPYWLKNNFSCLKLLLLCSKHEYMMLFDKSWPIWVDFGQILANLRSRIRTNSSLGWYGSPYYGSTAWNWLSVLLLNSLNSSKHFIMSPFPHFLFFKGDWWIVFKNLLIFKHDNLHLHKRKWKSVLQQNVLRIS